MGMDLRRIEVVDDATAEILRRKTPAERFAIVSDMIESAHRTLDAHIRAMCPHWTDEQVREEKSRRLYGAPR
jgi:hypothetical protein